ncbi:MAG TPA: hypothetical protein EYG97_00185 [Arcobacter sp.]|nr:hypothetical protein [Arcobacter sp.]HIP55426.1 hypothetical protein [Arcobacter sp.]
MQINSNPYAQANVNIFEDSSKNTTQKNQTKELSLEEELNKSAVEVSLSMGAQLILLMMEASKTTSDNSEAQKDILDFLGGKVVDDNFSLDNIGYEGKPITELTKEEASELVGENGFFGVEQTSGRVANFVLGFSGDDLEKLQAGRSGIVQGFEDATKMWGGELPEISYQTQKRTLEIIDAKIAELKGVEASPREKEEIPTKVDITV